MESNQFPETQPEETYMEVDLMGWELSRQAQAGENVAALLEHPGFSDLVEIVKLHGEGILAQLLFRKPDFEAASYADCIGHLRGLREIEPIARGVVENGKSAAAALRAEEED